MAVFKQIFAPTVKVCAYGKIGALLEWTPWLQLMPRRKVGTAFLLKNYPQGTPSLKR
jgi:hypothetical protein